MFEQTDFLNAQRPLKNLSGNPIELAKTGVSNSGYTYQNFLSDCYDFMMDSFEETNTYFTAPTSIFLSEENKEFVMYGLENDILWVVPLNGTDFTYIEIVKSEVREDLLKYYVNEYLESQNLDAFKRSEEFDNILFSIKKNYLDNLVKCMTELHHYLSEEEQPKPIGICSSLDTPYDGKNGLLVPVYKVPLSQFVLLVSSAKLKVINLYEKSPRPFYENNKGYLKRGLDNLTVNATGSVVFVEGVRSIK